MMLTADAGAGLVPCAATRLLTNSADRSWAVKGTDLQVRGQLSLHATELRVSQGLHWILGLYETLASGDSSEGKLRCSFMSDEV